MPGLLDAAVAKAEGRPFSVEREAFPDGTPTVRVIVDFMPSTKWEDGGPIIDRERIALVGYGGTWDAALNGFVATDFSISSEHGSAGEAEDAPTALVAAMRAFVGAKLGAEVDL
jgi:Protein of unknown function (DUF2591)